MKNFGLKIYEDKFLKIINKNPGIISEDISQLICHRLDKDTSGAIIIAKNQKTKDTIQEQFKNRKVKKTYLVLLDGKLIPKKDTILASIGRKKSKNMMMSATHGRKAETKYEVKKYLTNNTNIFTLCLAYPKTGRQHQIRAHFKYIGFPVMGDKIYAKGKTKKKSENLGIKRQFLHAKEIEFIHPKTKKIVKFQAKIPQDLKNILLKLKPAKLKGGGEK